MEKKRLVGVAIFVFISFLIGLYYLITAFILLLLPPIPFYPPSIKFFPITMSLLFSSILFFSAYKLSKFKKSGYLIPIIFLLVSIIPDSPSSLRHFFSTTNVSLLILLSAYVIYFNIPKVKEQFKKEQK